MKIRRWPLVLMGRAARRALAWHWFARGFSMSGVIFNGETYDLSKHPKLEALLRAEFDRRIDEELPS